MPPWPPGFRRVPEDPWTLLPVDPMAASYDAVGGHSWYANLDVSTERLAGALDDGEILLDHSGGTGLLLDRLLAAHDRDYGLLNVDASPKFLRCCLEKHRREPRVALRWLRFLSEERRLQGPEEVVGPDLLRRGFEAISCTNAVHLFPDLAGTAAAWGRLLRPGGLLHVQSGNMERADRPADCWIIDGTVAPLAEAAEAIVRTDAAFARHRPALEDHARREAHHARRRRVFLPPRPVAAYVAAIEAAGLHVESVHHRPVTARVEEWLDFLAVYHDSILGWVGGSPKVEGIEPGSGDVADRQALLRAAAQEVFGGEATFEAEWTYIDATAP